MPQSREIAWLKVVVQELLDTKAPITYTLLGVVIGVFVFEIGIVFRTDIASTHIFATGLFGVHPSTAWALSPVLHRDALHFFSNLVGLLLVGVAVERHWKPWRYVVFIVLSGYLATAAGALFMSAFSEAPIAYYGASGILAALSGYALLHLLRTHFPMLWIEVLALLIGLVMFLAVLSDPFTPPYFDPYWINVGHMAGFVIGAVVGRSDWCGCELSY